METTEERLSRIRREPQTDDVKFLISHIDWLTEKLEQAQFNMNCMREFAMPAWMRRGS